MTVTATTLPASFDVDAVTQRDVLLAMARRATLASLRSFVVAYPPSVPYLWGRHTVALCRELDLATKTVEQGGNFYACVCMPPRHGKSDLASRRWPVWSRLRNPDWEFIISGYNFEIASEMSYDARKLARQVAGEYGYQLSRDRSSLASWRFRDHKGAVHAAGLGGTITGRGAHCVVVDDYLKNREEAESETIRQKRWEAFENDLMTRLAPHHAVVIVANRWHEDDLVGRIIARNTAGGEDYDPEFPQFQLIRFPAWSEEYGWLFPERFPEAWYKAERAFMGSYGWNAQGLQEPRPRTGNLLRADLVNWIDLKDVPKGLYWRRGWDLARTEKQRTKDKPDFTVGTLAAFDDANRHLYVRHVKRGQWSTLKRDEVIRKTAEQDGPEVNVYVEVGPDSKDAYQYLRKVLSGLAVVRKVLPQRDKVVRAGVLEPLFEAGNVFVIRGAWNRVWQQEMLAFPGGVKDDQVDSLVVATYKDVTRQGQMGIGKLW